MGCGKSSIGRRLSELLCCRFIDLDSFIEGREGRSVSEIFATDGEAAFRQMELEALKAAIHSAGAQRVEKQSLPSPAMGPSLCGQRGSTVSPPSVHRHGCHSGDFLQIIALGGGTVMTPQCAELVMEKTLCIYLKASAETLLKHLEGEAEGRPMLDGDLRSRIGTLMQQRSETYEKNAHIIIDTDGRSIEVISTEIVDRLNQ